MDKTLHNKLTSKQSFAYTPAASAPGSDDIFSVLRHEKRILDALAKDLLQPRPEAIKRILEMAGKI